MTDLEELTAAIERGDWAVATRSTQEAIDAKVNPQAILAAMTKAMDNVGQRFQCKEIYVPEMLVAARAMSESVALLEPLMIQAGIKPDHTVVIGTVKGDLHDIGKNLVGMMWRGANFEVIDLGTDVAVDAFATAVIEHDASLVGVSALLTTTMPAMRDVVEAVHAVRHEVKVLVGGAPVTPEYAEQIGADGYAKDAGSAVAVARRLLAT